MKWINYIIQFFFIRVTRCEDLDVLTIIISSALGFESKYTKARRDYYWYSIQLFIVPLSGWYGDFIYVLGPKFLKVSPKRTFCKHHWYVKHRDYQDLYEEYGCTRCGATKMEDLV